MPRVWAWDKEYAMKTLRHLSVFIISLLCAATVALAVSGSWTPWGMYKPPWGLGQEEQNAYNTGINRLDGRLNKEIWVGDPLYGATIQTAVTAIASNSVILRVPAGTHSIGADLTIPANITLKPERGANLAVATTKTLTISGGLEAGHYQIFSYVGTGTVVYNGSNPVKSAWWGTGATSVQNAINAVNNGSRTIYMPGGRLEFSTTSVNVTKQVTLLGQGGHSEETAYGATDGTTIRYAGSGHALYLTTNAGGSYASLLQDFSIDCNNAGAGGIKVGNSTGSPKGFNGTIRNVTVVKATGDGIWVNYAVDAKFDNVRSSYNAGVGFRIYFAYCCDFKLMARYNGQVGILLDTLDSNGNIQGCDISFDSEVNGYEGVKINAYNATSIDRVHFRRGWLESNLTDAGRTTGYFQFLSGTNMGGELYQTEMGLENISFRDVTSPWNGTTGNRQLSLGGGRWTINGISDWGSNTQNYPSFITSGPARLVMSANEGVLAKWNLSPYSGIEGTVSPLLSITPLSSTGTGETTLHQFTIPKNTIGRPTYIDGVFKPAYGYGNAGVHIKAAGTKTGAAGNKTVKLYFGSTAVATIPAANNTNGWEFEAWVMNNSNAGAQGVRVHVYDASTLTVSQVDLTEAITENILVKVSGQCVNGGDAVVNNFFMLQRF